MGLEEGGDDSCRLRSRVQRTAHSARHTSAVATSSPETNKPGASSALTSALSWASFALLSGTMQTCGPAILGMRGMNSGTCRMGQAGRAVLCCLPQSGETIHPSAHSTAVGRRER